jgi:hypothetical protein
MRPKRSRVERACGYCGSAFRAKPSAIDRGSGKFCSRICAKSKPLPVIEISADGVTGRIPLHAADGTVRAYAVIDAADAEWAGQWRWCLSHKYAARTVNAGDGIRYTVYLHCELLGLTRHDDFDGDHINRDKLDCRRSNLRAIPLGKNVQNVGNRGGGSVHRGVTWDERRRKWRARVSTVHVGRFDTEEEAVAAVRAARKRLLPYATD